MSDPESRTRELGYRDKGQITEHQVLCPLMTFDAGYDETKKKVRELNHVLFPDMV